jgi:hypothetical protein
LEQILCLETIARKTGEEFEAFYEIPKVHYHIQKSPLLDSIMQHFNLDQLDQFQYSRVQSFCYAMTASWGRIPGPIPGNGSVNTFPQQQTRTQQ